MTTNHIQAIDVHAHYGTYFRPGNPLLNQFMTGDAQTVVDRATLANTRLTIVSPLTGLLPRYEADACAGNEEACRIVPATSGLLQWVIVNPLQPSTYEQAAAILKQPQCVGIKLHPEEHGYLIADHGGPLFEFAADHDAIVLVHSGDENSLPHAFVPFADEHPNVRLILAHLGNGGGAGGDPTLQVRAIQAGKHDNLYVDTSSARSIMPGLIEWAVGEIGSQRILYGTDTPLYFAPMQRTRIDTAGIPDADKCRILCENAERLFGQAHLNHHLEPKRS